MEKKRIFSKIKSFALLAALFIFAFNSVGGVVFAVTAPVTGGGTITPKTSAELAPIADRAISWSILSAFAEDQCRFKQTISTQDVNDGKVSSESDVSVGTVAAPEKGVVPCNQAFKLVEQNWTGGDTANFLKNIGYELNGDNYVQKSYSADKLRAAIPARMFFTTNRSSADSALLYYIFYQNFVTGCKATPFKPIGPAAPEGATQNEINQANTDDNTYRIFTVQQNGDIKDYIFKGEQGKGVIISVGYGIGTQGAGKADCQELSDKLKNKDLAIAYTSILGLDTSAVGATTTSSSSTTNTNDGCYSGISVFGWILCPMLDLADGIYGFLRSSVFSLLAIPELTSSSSNGLQASWAAVRGVANTLLVLVALFMIASQIFNFSFVDAYTVKKVLPRLVIAVILIQLSWFIFTTMIELFNALGYGLNWLITAPFQANGGGDIVDIVNSQSSKDIGAATIFTGSGLVIGGTAFVVGTVLSGGFFMTIALVAIGVIISVAAVILTLIIRKLLIIALLILAPIALVAWILPNTQKFWNSWWQLFSKLLIMFPLIALLFAAGQIFAAITAKGSSSSTAEGGLKIVLVIIAYFAPLFLIPATFKFAGGIFGSITGALNGAGSKMKGGKMFGLREKRDASRKAVTEEKNRNAYNRIGAGKGTPLDRWRTNTMGGAILPTTKSAYSRRTELAVSQGKKLQHDEAQQLVGNAINGLYGEDKFNQLETIAMGLEVTGKNGQVYQPDHYAQAIAHSQLLKQKQAANADRVAQHLQSTDMDTWQLLQDENYAEINGLTPDKLVTASGKRIKGSHQLSPTAFSTVEKGRFQIKKNNDGSVTKGAYVQDIEQALATSNKEQLDNYLVQLNSISKTAQQAGIPPEVISGLKDMGHPAVKQVLSSDGALQLQHTFDPITKTSVFTAVPAQTSTPPVSGPGAGSGPSPSGTSSNPNNEYM